ncbi:MAG: ABC transporter substrate-binding protein [Pseudomonadota bacterium]
MNRLDGFERGRGLTRRRGVLTAVLGAAALGLVTFAPPAVDRAAAEDPIKIGELNSYNRFAAFSVPYRHGFELAFEEINAAGGVLGRQIEVISRDDGATTGDAVRVAEELVSRENVDFIFGTFLSNIGLAVADFANQRKTLFLAAEPLTDALTMGAGNRYTYRIRPNTHMQTAMLVEAAKDLGAKRWAIVVPNYEYGQAAAANFKKLAPEAMEGIEIVVEQYPALGKIDAGATISAIEQAKPDAIFSALFGGDLAKFVREGTTRGLFENRTVLSLLTGEPEWLLPLADEAPEGWIVTGYPWDEVEGERHQAFVDAYQAKVNDTPRLGSLLGYQMGYLIKAMLEKAGSTDTEAMLAALEDLEFDGIVGPAVMRGIDNQATIGIWVGKITNEGGKGKMVDFVYKDGADYMFPEEEVSAPRSD